jgi:predicted nucleic acid-binding protein
VSGEPRGDLYYLDSSALVKLVLPEAESARLAEGVQEWRNCVTSELATVEVMRAVRRASADPRVEQRALEVLAGVSLLRMDSDVLARAARLEPRTLRSLDALHLASALSLQADLRAMVIYDAGLAVAARGCGLEVVAPE